MEFIKLDLRNGLLQDLSTDEFPTKVFGWNDSDLSMPSGATHYGMVTRGTINITDAAGCWTLTEGMFFVIPGEAKLKANKSNGLLISRIGYIGVRQIGGPLEEKGRLNYINGCSDSVLAYPPKIGDPCLNHLHIPPGVDQTAHTHPSERIGVIVRGKGKCITPGGTATLEPGYGWRIPTGCLHSFHTEADSVDVIAWHPDSDFGPSDENHPMINRTIIGTNKAPQR